MTTSRRPSGAVGGQERVHRLCGWVRALVTHGDFPGVALTFNWGISKRVLPSRALTACRQAGTQDGSGPFFSSPPLGRRRRGLSAATGPPLHCWQGPPAGQAAC